MAQVAETLGCPNPKDLRQEWPSSRQALGTSSLGDQGCNCGTVDLKPTAHRVPSPQGTDEGSSCVTLESHGPSLGSMSLWAGSLGVTGVSFGIQSLTPTSLPISWKRIPWNTRGLLGRPPTPRGRTTRDMTLSLPPVPPTSLCPSGLEDPAYQSPPHSKPGFPSM